MQRMYVGESNVKEPRHFIHYVPRRVVVHFPRDPRALWFADAQHASAGFRRPVFHKTRSQTGAATRVRKGDVIWIVSQLDSPWGRLPPGIDARLCVRHIERDGDAKEIRFEASSRSVWLPLADARSVLADLRTLSAQGRTSTPLWPHEELGHRIGHYLQSMRELESAAPLIAWEKKLARRPLSFVSYRICDGTKHAFLKSKELLEQGRAVFWDRWCLPRCLAERREVVSDAALDRYLMIQLKACATVFGIESPLYSEPSSYSAKEGAAARHLGTYRSVGVAG
jgi:hypothetical protein